SHTIFEFGSIRRPASGRISSPFLPTAHSMNRPSPETFGSFVNSAGSMSSGCCRRASAWCVILRASLPTGRISIARTQRGSDRLVGTLGRHHASCATGGIVYSGDFTTRSGSPYLFAIAQPDSSFQTRGAGMSFGSPFGAPAFTQLTIVSICSSESDRSFLNFWMPIVLSMCHGGICRAATRAAIDLAQGRACSYVISDIGAMLSGRWHDSHFCWKIGATSLVNVGVFGASAAVAGSAATIRPLNASAIETRNIMGSFQPTSAVTADRTDRERSGEWQPTL